MKHENVTAPRAGLFTLILHLLSRCVCVCVSPAGDRTPGRFHCWGVPGPPAWLVSFHLSILEGGTAAAFWLGLVFSFVCSYLVMPFMGTDLGKLMKMERLTEDRVQFLVYQMLRGLKVRGHERFLDSQRNPHVPTIKFASWWVKRHSQKKK